MKKSITLFVNALFICLLCQAAPERKQLFDFDWMFALNDTVNWRQVDLPHDWSIEGSFDNNAPAGNDGGYLPTGKGYYRKTFTLNKDYEGKVLRLYFEGVYMNAEVYVNGQLAGGHPYGYASFFVNITPYIYIKKPNVIEVRVDNSQQKNCRWYSGSGIYRHVWLLTTGKRYIDEWSVRVSTPDTHTVEMEADVVMEDGSRKTVTQRRHIATPHLWSPDDPYLYHTTIAAEGDRLPLTYGIRTLEFSALNGMLLNGRPIKLNGGCIHHDNGILGAAAFDAAEYRKVQLMKEAGFNAVRTSHNPPSETFLRACDELGLLVIDEAFDGWRVKKNDYDYHMLIDQWWQDDLRAMVQRDRNHPSIFCWSIGNEVIERKKIEVIKTAHQMATLCRQLDPTRPVTSALAAWDSDWDIYDPLAAEHDIVGYNYLIDKAESDHERVPERVMMQTESYPRDAWKNSQAVASHKYIIGDFVWTAIDYIGESGIGRWYYDTYVNGEKGDVPGEHYERPLYPWHAAYCGDIDLTGQRKPISYYRAMLWKDEPSYMAVREPDGYIGKIKETQWGTWPTFKSWNWPGWEGKNIEVEVYTYKPSVKLYLNDQLIGEHETKELKATFSLPYAPGTLKAECGDETILLTTAGEPAQIWLTADKKELVADGQDLAFITVEVVDANGVVNTTANQLLTATVKGAGKLMAFGNADIKDTDSYASNMHKAWKGRALLVVRGSRKSGHISVNVTAPGLKGGTVQLKAKN